MWQTMQCGLLTLKSILQLKDLVYKSALFLQLHLIFYVTWKMNLQLHTLQSRRHWKVFKAYY